MSLRGVIPAICSLSKQDDRVDKAGLRRLGRYLLNAGVHGIFADGSMGGFAFLTDDEQVRSVPVAVSEAAGEVPVIGVYFFATQEHLIDYFGEIAAATTVPAFIYDNPVMANKKLEPEDHRRTETLDSDARRD